MNAPLHILHLEDNPDDAVMIQLKLSGGGIVSTTTHVENRSDFLTAVERGGIDLFLSDFCLPGFNGFWAIAVMRSRCPGTPIILVSGAVGEEAVLDAVEGEMTDFVSKDHLSCLVPAVRRVLARSVVAR